MAGRLTPNCIRSADVEVLLQSIGCSDRRLDAILAGTAFIADLGPQVFIPHEFSDRVSCAGLAKAQQIMTDFTVSIDTTAF